MFVNRREGSSLRLGYEGPTVDSVDFGDVAAVDGAAILSDDNELHVYAVNRSVDSAVDLEINLFGSQLDVVSGEILHHPTPTAQNTWHNPHTVGREEVDFSGSETSVMQLPSNSFVAVTFKVS